MSGFGNSGSGLGRGQMPMGTGPMAGRPNANPGLASYANSGMDATAMQGGGGGAFKPFGAPSMGPGMQSNGGSMFTGGTQGWTGQPVGGNPGMRKPMGNPGMQKGYDYDPNFSGPAPTSSIPGFTAPNYFDQYRQPGSPPPSPSIPGPGTPPSLPPNTSLGFTPPNYFDPYRQPGNPPPSPPIPGPGTPPQLPPNTSFGQPPMPIADPHRDYGSKPQIAPQPAQSQPMQQANEIANIPAGYGQARTMSTMGTYVDEYGIPRYREAPFVPNAGQWARLGDPRQGGDLVASTAGGANTINNIPFAAESLNQSGGNGMGVGFGNVFGHLQSLWNQQRGR